MYQTIQFKTTTLPIRNSVSWSPLPLGFFFIPIVLVCFGLSLAPNVFGVVPAPDGGYPGSNTAEGTQALFSLTTGTANTADGFQALFHNTTGVDNAATGWRALFHNTTGDDNTATGSQALFHNTTGFNN